MCCNIFHIEEVPKITDFNLNINSEYSAPLNQSRFPYRKCDISLTQDQTGSISFLMSQKYIFYFRIGSKLCLRTSLKKYNVGGYASGTDIVVHLWLFLCLIDYICGFRKDMQIIEYTKDKRIYQNNYDVLQWDINAQCIICYNNKLELINLMRE